MNEQITAYVLNELGTEEREAFENELKNSRELQKQVEEMQAFFHVLNKHIPKTSAADFTQQQREQLLSVFQSPATKEDKKSVARNSLVLRPILLSSAALAACVAFLFVIFGVFDEPNTVLVQPEILIQEELDKAKQQQAQNFTRESENTSNRLAAKRKEAYDDISRLAEEPLVPSTPMPTAAPMDQFSSSAIGTIAGRAVIEGDAPMIGSPHRNREEKELSLQTASNPSNNESRFGRRYSTVEVEKPALVTKVDKFGISPVNSENYQTINENSFLEVTQHPLSTFSVHTDGASYANVRRFLNSNQRPPANAVRIEELINYFPYEYEPPSGQHPFAVHVDIREAPWQPMHRLARIAIKGLEVHQDRKPANLVFLIDVSGSMDEPSKLPLVKQSMELLLQQLRDTDRVAIVTYAGDSNVTLESTPATDKVKILEAIQSLRAAGSTNGAGGIKAAYQQARSHLIKDGINRVILCSDGDFNVGVSNPKDLEKLISEEAKSKVFLSVLGFGTGNLNDHIMETLATKGNGNHAYIDSLSESRKVLVEQLDATLMTIAKDVKIQIEFNPAQVASYRLIGYENRSLKKEDFNNDKVDAGEIGAGHTVTALYEIVPANVKYPNGKPLVDELKYTLQKSEEPKPSGNADANPETMTVKLRYKQPEGDTSQLIELPVIDRQQTLESASPDFKFSAAVAGFGMLLRNSEHAGELTWDQVRQLALQGKGSDPLGYRGEFIQLIDKAHSLTK